MNIEKKVRPKILVTREVFDETLEYLREHCEVDANQEDVALAPDALARRLADKDAVMCSLTDRIDAALVAAWVGSAIAWSADDAWLATGHVDGSVEVRHDGDLVALPFRKLSAEESRKFLFEIMTPEQRATFVAAVALEVVSEDPRAIADVVFDVVEVAPALLVVSRPQRHHLHEPACTDTARRIRLEPALDDHDGQHCGDIEALPVGLLDDRPRHLPRHFVRHAAAEQHFLNRFDVLPIQADSVFRLRAGGADAMQALAQSEQLHVR